MDCLNCGHQIHEHDATGTRCLFVIHEKDLKCNCRCKGLRFDPIIFQDSPDFTKDEPCDNAKCKHKFKDHNPVNDRYRPEPSDAVSGHCKLCTFCQEFEVNERFA